MAFNKMSLMERFWDKVNPEPMSGCWLWSGGCTPKGYGVFWGDRGREYAYRFAYRILVAEFSEEQIDHKCSNPYCVNPDHLEPVSGRENLSRTRERGRGFVPPPTHGHETHCPKGHPYSGDNLYIRPNGKRECRECLRDQQRRRTRRRNGLPEDAPSLENSKKTHCKRGHPLSGENLYTAPSKPGGRWCKACRDMRKRGEI